MPEEIEEPNHLGRQIARHGVKIARLEEDAHNNRAEHLRLFEALNELRPLPSQVLAMAEDIREIRAALQRTRTEQLEREMRAEELAVSRGHRGASWALVWTTLATGLIALAVSLISVFHR